MRQRTFCTTVLALPLIIPMLVSCASSALAGSGGPPLKPETDPKKISNRKHDAAGATALANDFINPVETQAHITELRKKKLRLPLDGADIEKVNGHFYLGRAGHMHEAIDLVAPRNTPVHAVEDGTIERLFESKNGGLTIYQKDKTCKYVSGAGT